jgi:hypothetical protein
MYDTLHERTPRVGSRLVGSRQDVVAGNVIGTDSLDLFASRERPLQRLRLAVGMFRPSRVISTSL